MLLRYQYIGDCFAHTLLKNVLRNVDQKRVEGLAVDAPDNRGAAAGAGGAREPELRRPGAIACGPLGRYRAPRFCEPSLRSDNRAMFILL